MVICVRSLVPKEKNSAWRPMLSATSAARGVSIIVPAGSAMVSPRSAKTVGATARMTAAWALNSRTVPTSGTMISAFTAHALGLHVQRRLEDGAGLHLGDLGVGDAQAAAAVAEHGVELVQFLDAHA
jgi:hypothetical protein